MPSRFQQLWIARRPTLDALMAEAVTIQPMIRGEFEGAHPNPNIPAFIASGIPIVEDILAMAGSMLLGTAERTDVIMSAPEITFLPSQFDLNLRLPPVAGDRIIRHTWPGSPSYELISPPLIDSVGQLCCRLSPVLEGLNYAMICDTGNFGVIGCAGTMIRVP